MKTQVLETLAQFITAAFAFVAALAWNTVILSVFQTLFSPGSGLAAIVGYAVVVTIVAVFATIWIGRAVERAKGADVKSEEEKLRRVS